MTIFEYIKEKATKEEIATLFTFLENDSGYYSESNTNVLLLLGKNINFGEKLNPEDYKTYKMAMKNLDKEVQFNDQK